AIACAPLKRACSRLVVQPAGLGKAFAEPGDLGAIDHGCPLAVRGPLGDKELARVRPAVDPGEAPPAEPGEGLEAAGHVDVAPRAQAELADRRHDLRRILRLDSD